MSTRFCRARISSSRDAFGAGASPRCRWSRLERPVRWTDTRQDSFISTTHAGDQLHDVTIALAADGEILALADDFLIDAGAYLPRGAVVANVTATHLVGLYHVPAFRCRGRVVV